MLKLIFERRVRASSNILFLGAHADDIEIGCGGTVSRLLHEHSRLNVCWVVFSADERRGKEARASARLFLKGATAARIEVEQFRDGFFPFEGCRIKEYVEGIARAFPPDIIFTHSREDRHQDHRVVSDLTWQTFRDHLILEYEIPKYDGESGPQNLYVSLDEAAARIKARRIVRAFPSQKDRHWFNEGTFLSLMRVRGVECRSPGMYAEAFCCRKCLL